MFTLLDMISKWSIFSRFSHIFSHSKMLLLLLFVPPFIYRIQTCRRNAQLIQELFITPFVCATKTRIHSEQTANLLKRKSFQFPQIKASGYILFNLKLVFFSASLF